MNVELEAVVCPRTVLHAARLDVEWEVSDVDGTGRLEDGRWQPKDRTVVLDDCHSRPVFLQPVVGAKIQEKFIYLCYVFMHSSNSHIHKP